MSSNYFKYFIFELTINTCVILYTWCMFITGCRYERISEDVTECKSRRQQMTLKLIEGDPQQCDATVTRQKRCRNVGPKTPAQRSG